MHAWLFWRVSNKVNAELGSGRGTWFGSILDGSDPNAPAVEERLIPGDVCGACWFTGNWGIPYIVGNCIEPGSMGAP